jgi:hypothetical protein
MLAYIERKIAVLDRHPLFTWLASDEVPLKARLLIVPTVATVAMGFRDVNKWVLRYPRATGELERGINVHTFEDQTHSRLFLEDWRRLGLDRRLGWSAGDTLWWLFLADANEVIRGHCMYFLSLAAADGGDPLLRFAHAEVAELCARDVFFKHVSGVATRLAEQTGLTCLYFGPHHIASEGEGAEGVFEARVLDESRRRRAVELCDVMADIFAAMFDAIYDYARRYVQVGAVPRPPADRAASAGFSHGGGSGVRPRADGLVHPSQVAVQRLLDERKARTAAHPFYTWLHHRGGRVSALQALQRFIPMWAMDIMGYRDLNRYALRYPEPAGDLELAVNGWADELTTHNTLYLNDWRQLDLDELLGWNASDTLEFCYLDRLMEPHRHKRVVTAQLATGHRDPLLRLWLMNAIEATNRLFLDNTSVLAAEAEADHGIRLDFLAGRHPGGHRPEPRPVPSCTASPMTPAQRDVAAEMVDTIFDFTDEQLDVALDVALSNTFAIP